MGRVQVVKHWQKAKDSRQMENRVMLSFCVHQTNSRMGVTYNIRFMTLETTFRYMMQKSDAVWAEIV